MVIVERGTGIVELAQLMLKHHVNDMIVVPVEIVTDRVIVVALIAEKVDIDSMTA